jgi:hypothetical protein
MDLNVGRDKAASPGRPKIILSGSLNHTFGGRAPRSDRGESTRGCEVVSGGSREETRWMVPVRKLRASC